MTPALVSNNRRWGVVGLLFAASLINYLDRVSLSLALYVLYRTLVGRMGGARAGVV